MARFIRRKSSSSSVMRYLQVCFFFVTSAQHSADRGEEKMNL